MTPRSYFYRNPNLLRYISNDDLVYLLNLGYTIIKDESRFGYESTVYQYKKSIVELVSIFNNNLLMGNRYRQSIRMCGKLSTEGISDFSITKGESLAIYEFEDFLRSKGYHTSVGDVSKMYKRLPEYSIYQVYREILVAA